MRNLLYAHNAAAYQAAAVMLAENGKAAVIHPTGTGKSFVGFQLCADFPQGRVYWLSPSEYICFPEIFIRPQKIDGLCD